MLSNLPLFLTCPVLEAVLLCLLLCLASAPKLRSGSIWYKLSPWNGQAHRKRKRKRKKSTKLSQKYFFIRCNKYSLDSPETFSLVKLWKLNPNVFTLNLKNDIILTEYGKYFSISSQECCLITLLKQAKIQ